MDSYCVFCMTGREKNVIEQFNKYFSNNTLKSYINLVKIVKTKSAMKKN
jgi:hypothetical protein